MTGSGGAPRRAFWAAFAPASAIIAWSAGTLDLADPAIGPMATAIAPAVPALLLAQALGLAVFVPPAAIVEPFRPVLVGIVVLLLAPLPLLAIAWAMALITLGAVAKAMALFAAAALAVAACNAALKCAELGPPVRRLLAGSQQLALAVVALGGAKTWLAWCGA
jgi:hypothetical protein